MKRRVLVLIVLIAMAGVARWYFAAAPIVPAASLDDVPFSMGEWQGRRGADLPPNVEAALAADSYINRAYVDGHTGQANVFVGYHPLQQQGTAIHSPLNCMPGAGWSMEHVERVAFGESHVRRVVIRKGTERLLVVYWYQTATRSEGEEYRARLYSVVDTLRSGRNDAAFVRVTVPIGNDLEGEVRAAQQAFELAALLQPHVQRLLFDPAGTDGDRARRLTPDVTSSSSECSRCARDRPPSAHRRACASTLPTRCRRARPTADSAPRRSIRR